MIETIRSHRSPRYLLMVGVLALLNGCSRAPEVVAVATDSSQQASSEIAGPAAAESPTQPDAPASGMPSRDSSLRAYVDPVTGQLREPTEAEMTANAKQQQSARSVAEKASVAKAPRTITLPDGTIGFLEAPEPHSIKACVRPDGSLAVDEKCSDTANASGDQR